MRLTKNETKALEELSRASCGEKFMPNTVNGLVQKGLVASTFSTIGWKRRFAITEAGRAALEGK